MTTLALDLGKSIGWIKGAAVGPLEHGVIELGTDTDLGAWLMIACMKLPPLMRGVHDIAVEQPFLGDSYYPARKLLGLLGVVYLCANGEGIPGSMVHEYAVPTAKKALTGYGKAEKDQMIAAAIEWWGLPDDISEHEADASAILKVHRFGPAPPARKKPRSSKGVSLLNGQAR